MTLTSLKFIPLFATGILLYTAKKSGGLTPVTACLVMFCVLVVGLIHTPSAALVDAGLGLLLWLVVDRRLPQLACRPLVALGALSYSLYLVHQNVGYVLIREFQLLGATPTVSIALATTFASGLAVWLHHRVEKPSLSLLRSGSLMKNLRTYFEFHGKTSTMPVAQTPKITGVR